MILAPEYGGDGKAIGRCAQFEMPVAGFPAHYAPVDLQFFTGAPLPAKYRGGAFVVMHGSWNRAPAPMAGYNVLYQPFAKGRPSGRYEVFADGFKGKEPLMSPERRRGAAQRHRARAPTARSTSPRASRADLARVLPRLGRGGGLPSGPELQLVPGGGSGEPAPTVSSVWRAALRGVVRAVPAGRRAWSCLCSAFSREERPSRRGTPPAPRRCRRRSVISSRGTNTTWPIGSVWLRLMPSPGCST